MKYLQKDENTVQVEGVCVPRGHRFWVELGIQEAEDNGEIEAYVKVS